MSTGGLLVALPQSHLFSRVEKLQSCSLCSQDECSSPWPAEWPCAELTPVHQCLSCAGESKTRDRWCHLRSAEWSGINTILELLAVFLVIQPRMPWPCFTAREHCGLMLSSPCVRTPKAFSAELLSSQQPWRGLFLSKWRFLHLPLLKRPWGPLLQPRLVSLSGSFDLECIDCPPQFNVICKLDINFVISSSSLIKTLNMTHPRIDPCDPPLVAVLQLECDPLVTTLWVVIPKVLQNLYAEGIYFLYSCRVFGRHFLGHFQKFRWIDKC